MKMTFRWFGEDDPVSLTHIRRIPGMSGIVSSLHGVPVGGVWPTGEIESLRSRVAEAGLKSTPLYSTPAARAAESPAR